MISRTELVKVMFNKGGSIYSGPGKQKKKSQKVPYKAMYSDMAIWAILVIYFKNYIFYILHRLLLLVILWEHNYHFNLCQLILIK
jgi:hypothetical protein